MYEHAIEANLEALAKRLAEGQISLEEYERALNILTRDSERLANLTSMKTDTVK